MARVINYFAIDFDTFKRETLALLQNSASWQDMYEGGAGTTLVELFSYVGASLSYYIMRAAEEAFLSTCKLRSSLIRHCRSLGYEPRLSTAATGTVRFSIPQARSKDVLLPIGTQVTTEDGRLFFETTEEKAIVAGQTYVDVLVEQKRTFRQVLVGNGKAKQTLILDQTPYLDGKTTATDNLGYIWTEVESLHNYTGEDRVFTVDVDAEDRATVQFGDGINGMVPTNITVTVVYAVGGGKVNLPVNMVKKISSRIYDSANSLVDGVVVTNQYTITGGTEAESLESARANAIATLKSNSRTIAGEDFENNAIKTPGVARAMWQTRNENASIPENTVYVYIVPTDGFTIPDEQLLDLISATRATLTSVYPCPPTLRVDVYKAPNQDVDIAVNVTKKPTASAAEVQAAVEQAILDYFDYTARENDGSWVIDFGQPVYLSDLYSRIAAVEGVQSAIITSPTGNVTIPDNTMPSVGALTVVVS